MIISYNTQFDNYDIINGLDLYYSFPSYRGSLISLSDYGVANDSVEIVDITEQRSKYRISAMAERAIQDWATHAVSCGDGYWGGSVIWDKPSEDRPNKPYITLNFPAGPIPLGGPDKNYHSLDTWAYTYRKAITLSLSVCANNAYMYYMNKILDSFYKECCYKYLRQAGLAYWRHYGPFDLSTLIDAEFEFRVNVDIVFSFGHVEYVKTGEIHKVKINDWLDIEIP